MIFKGRARADGGKLAAYLLSDKNEQVRVLDVRGTVIDEKSAQGLKAALGDMDELGKMTRAKSSLFHLAINPDARDRMTADGWQQSVEKAEKALGLEGHPRAVVSHLYEGKEHLHVVWSRVDVEGRKCVEMSFSHLKLCRAAREIEIDLSLEQTPARARGAHKLNQHIKDIQKQQDERSETPRDDLNATVANAWQGAGSAQEFKTMIESAGLQLATGKRGVLVMDGALETYSIPRCVDGVKVKDVRERLGGLEGLPTVEEVRERTTRTKQTETQRAKTGEIAPGSEQPAPPLTPRSAQNASAPTLEGKLTADNGDVEKAELMAARDEREAITPRPEATAKIALRTAKDIVMAKAAQEMTADNDNAAKPDAVALPDATELRRRQAKDWIAPQPEETAREDKGSAQPDTPARQYTPFKSENEAQFAARVARLQARAEREKDKPKPELQREPRGRGMSY